ncbi:hypothetical protein F8568_024800 [Actinomadura sp. LD22]|uniref:Uncharacterized protein n=1 Tax=Actinomadura physcomitrii TaxID=2650748 RepID=A0A6I4MCW3_9ACTN|nr:hypothetical protein [Actinomadura physcomitrii]MWA03543.1 hypothetical protein [Actinomadura physcomitrii]
MTQAPLRCGPRPADAFRPADALLPAALDLVRPCPARADFIELCFTTPEGPFQWCFSDPARDEEPVEEHGDGPLALAIGPYGVQAHHVRGGGPALGPAIQPGAALPMILAGAEVLIMSRLVTANR